MKGIILAGGSGTRLYPITEHLSKQLLPVYDKPLIYYPITTLMSAGIKDILIISTPRDINLYQAILKEGSQWGIHFEFQVQEKPNGIAEAFILAEDFIADDNVCLALGDNIFYGNDINPLFQNAANTLTHATIFAYHVSDPERYGVIEFQGNHPIHIIEKPKIAPSNFAVTGLYMYSHSVVDIAKSLKPSRRGELEITDVNQYYLEQQQLTVVTLGNGCVWLDTGTPKSLMEASQYFAILEERQGLKACIPETVALEMGYINAEQFKTLAKHYDKSSYGKYLLKCLEEKHA